MLIYLLVKYILLVVKKLTFLFFWYLIKLIHKSIQKSKVNY